MKREEYARILGENGAAVLDDILDGHGGGFAGNHEAVLGILSRLREAGGKAEPVWRDAVKDQPERERVHIARLKGGKLELAGLSSRGVWYRQGLRVDDVEWWLDPRSLPPPPKGGAE